MVVSGGKVRLWGLVLEGLEVKWCKRAKEIADLLSEEQKRTKRLLPPHFQVSPPQKNGKRREAKILDSMRFVSRL